LPSRPCPYLQIGNKVRIEYGPLCGTDGILLGFRGHQRLVLSVTLLQRSVAVEVDEDWIQPLPLQRRDYTAGAPPNQFSMQPGD
jgi:transcription antitermination factor NusG